MKKKNNLHRAYIACAAGYLAGVLKPVYVKVKMALVSDTRSWG